jgi:hypothetical protein
MKKYLLGSGAMLVGAGLMFVLMHGEVSADSNPEPFVCSNVEDGKGLAKLILNCTGNGITCGVLLGNNPGISCVKSGGMFK